MSTFFLVPKKEADSWCPIWNLKPLSEGCIPTHPYQTRPLEVPSIPIRRYPVRIHSAPIQSFYLTLRVYRVVKVVRAALQTQGSDDIHVHVSQRLAYFGPVSRSHHSLSRHLRGASSTPRRLALVRLAPSLPRRITQPPEETGLSYRGTHTE